MQQNLLKQEVGRTFGHLLKEARDFEQLSHRLYGLQYLLAALFGAITPFCSCSSIPLFIGFVKGGIPLRVTLAFLITSPLVNEVAVAMFLGSFGIQATVVYVVSGIVLGCLGGMFLGRLRLERYLSEWVRQMQAQSEQQAATWQREHTTFLQRLPSIIGEAWQTVRSGWSMCLWASA